MDPTVLVPNLGVLIAVLKVLCSSTHLMPLFPWPPPTATPQVLERIPGVRVLPGSQRCTWRESPVPMLKASYEQEFSRVPDP